MLRGFIKIERDWFRAVNINVQKCIVCLCLWISFEFAGFTFRPFVATSLFTALSLETIEILLNRCLGRCDVYNERTRTMWMCAIRQFFLRIIRYLCKTDDNNFSN